MKTKWQTHKISQVMAIAALLCGFVGAVGCRSVYSTMDIKTAAAESLSSYKRAKVVVSSKDADFSEQQIKELADLTIEGLKNTGRFNDVYARVLNGKLSEELTVSVAIPLVISPSFDGSQNIEAMVTLVDSDNGKVMASAQIKVRSRSGVLDVKPSETISKLAAQIIDYTHETCTAKTF